jgi:hypothetical protein
MKHVKFIIGFSLLFLCLVAFGQNDAADRIAAPNSTDRNSNCSQLQEQVNQHTTTIADLKRQLTNAKSRNKDLEIALSNTKNSATNASNTQQEQLNTVASERDAANQNYNSLKTDYESLRVRFAELARKNADLRNQLNQSKPSNISNDEPQTAEQPAGKQRDVKTQTAEESADKQVAQPKTNAPKAPKKVAKADYAPQTAADSPIVYDQYIGHDQYNRAIYLKANGKWYYRDGQSVMILTEEQKDKLVVQPRVKAKKVAKGEQ